MKCSKCGAQIPDNSRFCIMCGNKIEQQYLPYQPADQVPQQPYQPMTQPVQPAPAQAASSVIFGVKSISDRHYSLEDIARQQEENKNEIGLASAPPPKKKKKPPVSAAEDQDKLPDRSAGKVSDAKPSDTPARPWYYDLMKDPPDKKPAGSSPQPDQQSAPVQETALPQEAAPIQQPVPKAPPRPASAGPVFRYTITAPPVPTGMQRQTNIRLFGGNPGSAFAAVEAEYMQRKNSGQTR